jgi:hypothetical protein
LLFVVGFGLSFQGSRRLRAISRTIDKDIEYTPLAWRELTPEEEMALSDLSRVERRLFGSSIRYATDQAARPSTRTGRATRQSGFRAAFQFLVAREVLGLAAALGWMGILAEVAFDAAKAPSLAQGLTEAALFLPAALIFCSLLRPMLRARSLGQAFKASGSPSPVLPLPMSPPVPAPAIGGASVVVLALAIIGIGAVFLAASAAAPRTSGIFYLAMGVALLSGGLLGLLKRRPRRRTWTEEGPASS